MHHAKGECNSVKMNMVRCQHLVTFEPEGQVAQFKEVLTQTLHNCIPDQQIRVFTLSLLLNRHAECTNIIILHNFLNYASRVRNASFVFIFTQVCKRCAGRRSRKHIPVIVTTICCMRAAVPTCTCTTIPACTCAGRPTPCAMLCMCPCAGVCTGSFAMTCSCSCAGLCT